ncbi:MAG: MarR family winged helix-turn-helix transcriptional regulator [Maricaulaceae bacterium]
MITKNDDMLGTLIHDVAHNLRSVIDKELAPYNLTRVKWLALGIIRKNPGISQSGLAEKMELGVATVGRLVDRMEERDFVERVPNPEDRRANDLHLTNTSKALISELDFLADNLKATALVGIPDADVETANRVLGQIKTNLRAKLLSFAAATLMTGQKIMSSPEVSLLTTVAA